MKMEVLVRGLKRQRFMFNPPDVYPEYCLENLTNGAYGYTFASNFYIESFMFRRKYSSYIQATDIDNEKVFSIRDHDLMYFINHVQKYNIKIGDPVQFYGYFYMTKNGNNFYAIVFRDPNIKYDNKLKKYVVYDTDKLLLNKNLSLKHHRQKVKQYGLIPGGNDDFIIDE
jgi:hypothetical protein